MSTSGLAGFVALLLRQGLLQLRLPSRRKCPGLWFEILLGVPQHVDPPRRRSDPFRPAPAAAPHLQTQAVCQHRTAGRVTSKQHSLLENLPSRTQRQQTTHRTLRTQRNHPRTDLRAARSSATCPSGRRNLSSGRLCDRCCNRKCALCQIRAGLQSHKQRQIAL